MNSEVSRTIATCTIWLSVTCVLTWGVFRFNVKGTALGLIIFVGVPAIVCGAALLATRAIWKSTPGRSPPTP